MTGHLESINASRGGVPKSAIFEGLITEEGLDGDRQRDPRYHGGPDRAIVVFSLDVIRALQREGHPIAPGTTGENLTISGIDWPAVVPGCQLRVGEVQLQITNYTSPCEKIAGSFAGCDFTRISQKWKAGCSGLTSLVLADNLVQMGNPLTLA